MQNHKDGTIIISDTVLRKIYLSIYLKGLCVRASWRTERNCNILTPTLLAITAFLSRSPGLLNQCLWAQPLWDRFLNPASSLQLVWSPKQLKFLCTQLYNSSTPTFFLWTSQSHSFNPSTVKVIFWYSLSRCTCYLHGCISYFDSLAGS